MQWARGRYHGLGTEIFAKGSTYHGEYDSGARHGPGVCHYYNGDYYEGFWQRGEASMTYAVLSFAAASG